MRIGLRHWSRVVVFCLCFALGGCTAEQAPPSAGPPIPVAEEDKPSQPAASEPEFFEVEEGFTLLGLGDFEVFHAKPASDKPTWTAEGRTLRCTGKPRGYLYSKRAYRNFTLRLDYRFLPAADLDESKRELCNTGFMTYITGEHKQWPVSLEVQGKHVEMAHIKANGGAAMLEVQDDEAARAMARKPVGEWNSIEIVARDGALTSFLNGAKICESKPGELSEGPIGIQSEDFEFEVRNLRIRED
jgi:hypothetical protein